jgi:hypothetical protein
MQFVIGNGRWDPHLGAGCLPTYPNYGTSVISGYGRLPEGLICPQIAVIDV